MKKLLPIIIVAVLTNLIVLQIFNYSNNVPAEEVPYWDKVNSVIWAISMLAALIIAIINRKYLFKKAGWITATIVALLFCTPLPFILFVVLTN